ncbi:Uncharacterised protein [Bacteroides heparinolyticus]|uniref:Uncharacterized protein n=1 Tax=Prevotella heparinolytica TaxID=28113 RepID=A0A449I6Q0_9BACE|nr:Uncharacterised protein [Bacteroides heparinolyticus]
MASAKAVASYLVMEHVWHFFHTHIFKQFKQRNYFGVIQTLGF